MRNLYLYYDIVTLDSELQNQFSQMLRGGGAMNLVYESALMTTNTVPSPDVITQVLRNLARVKAMFVTFSTDEGNVAIGYVCEVRATRARRLSEYGPVAVSSSCASYNCFEASHIPGYDITCDTGISQSQCAELCCSESNCLGFDFSEAHDGRCCTGSVSRADGPFEHNGGSYLSCEKNGVTEQSSDASAVVSSSQGHFTYHSTPRSWHATTSATLVRGERERKERPAGGRC